MEQAGIRFTTADSNDPDEVGFVKWRPAMYIVDDLNNAFLLLDAFFKHISDMAAKEKSFEVHITPHIDINIDDTTWDELKYESYTLNDPTKTPPLKFFEAAPVYGKKVSSFNIEIHNNSEISIVMTHVFPYREGFERFGVQGGRINVTPTSKGDYVRLMPKIDVTKDEQTIIKVIEEVLHNVALRVLVDGTCDDESPVGKFLEKLRERPNMHF